MQQQYGRCLHSRCFRGYCPRARMQPPYCWCSASFRIRALIAGNSSLRPHCSYDLSSLRWLRPAPSYPLAPIVARGERSRLQARYHLSATRSATRGHPGRPRLHWAVCALCLVGRSQPAAAALRPLRAGLSLSGNADVCDNRYNYSHNCDYRH